MLSAMNSIQRVLERHGDEIREKMGPGGPRIPGRVLQKGDPEQRDPKNPGALGIQRRRNLPGPCMDIDDLAERFPDCDIDH